VARGRPTVYDVAREAGVSIASVSRYFSHPDALSARTRDRVAGAVTDLGYVQNAAARGLAGGRNETIALCLPDFDAPEEPLDLSESDGTVQVVRGESATAGSPSLFFNQVLSGLEVEARDRGLAVTVVIGRGADPSLDATLERLVGRVDGVVAVAGSLTSPQIQMLSAQVPVVLIADAGAEPNVDHIRSDNVAGMQALVRHLLDEHGVRRPAFLAGPVDSPDSLIRFEAYRGVLEERGMTIPAEPLLVGDFTQPGGRRLGERVLEARLCERPDRTRCDGCVGQCRDTGASGRDRDRVRRNPARSPLPPVPDHCRPVHAHAGTGGPGQARCPHGEPCPSRS
jgi:LacI family transcriptional regulator